MFGVTNDDFIDGVERIVTASEFIDMSEGAQVIFI
jgi:peroxiredoxin family protein